MLSKRLLFLLIITPALLTGCHNPFNQVPSIGDLKTISLMRAAGEEACIGKGGYISNVHYRYQEPSFLCANEETVPRATFLYKDLTYLSGKQEIILKGLKDKYGYE